MIKFLFPVLEEADRTHSLGIFSLEGDDPSSGGNGPSFDCSVMFASEQSAAVEARHMRSKGYGVNPHGYKIWEERLNAFRVIASVHTFEFSLRESETISQGHGYEIISLHERAILSCAYLGLSAAKSASVLNRGVATVNAHRRSVARKLDCSLSPIVIARVIYAHKTILEMSNFEPQIRRGKHYRFSDHATHSDLLQAIV